MIRSPVKFSAFLSLSVVILLMSIPAIQGLIEKADLPFVVYSSEDSVIIKSIRTDISGLHINDRIVSIDGIPLRSREDIEIIMDTRNTGDNIKLLISSENDKKLYTVTAVNYYSDLFIILQSSTAVIFLLVGWFVVWKSRGSKAAEIFYLMTSGVAILLVMTWGNINKSPDLSFISRNIFHLSYVLTPLLFVHFGLTFPADKSRKFRPLLYILYSAAAVISLINFYTFYYLTESLNAGSVHNYISSFTAGRYFLVLCVVASISIFFVSYARTEDPADKKKLKWIIAGYVVGPLGFAVLWVIPQAVTDYAFIPETFISLLMLAVPITFSISILKYHLLDIDFIINRSIVYSFLISVIVLIYFGIVFAASSFIHNINRSVLSTFAALFVAFLFNPIKSTAQEFVSRKFFRVQYNFREAVTSFFSEIKEIIEINALAEKVISGVSALIPAKKIALIDMSESRVLRGINFSDSDLAFLTGKIFPKHNLLNPVCVPEKVELTTKRIESDSLLALAGLVLVCVSEPVNGKVQLVLAMGEKKSSGRYYQEDLDLLNNILNTTSSVISRIKLQQTLMIKDLEAEKLQHEIHVAGEIQRNLLPRQIPFIEGYDLYAENIPAFEVGGDYYDFIKISECKTAFALGDVSGKGLPASMLMANLQATLRGQLLYNNSASEYISRANKLLYKSTDISKFVTLFFGILDYERDMLTYCNAGHNVPYFSQGGKELCLDTGGIILSWKENAEYKEGEVYFERDSILFLYSDGITEAFNNKEEAYGEERLFGLIRDNRQLSARDLAKRILKCINEFTAGYPQTDDITLVIIKRI